MRSPNADGPLSDGSATEDQLRLDPLMCVHVQKNVLDTMQPALNSTSVLGITHLSSI